MATFGYGAINFTGGHPLLEPSPATYACTYSLLFSKSQFQQLETEQGLPGAKTKTNLPPLLLQARPPAQPPLPALPRACLPPAPTFPPPSPWPAQPKCQAPQLSCPPPQFLRPLFPKATLPSSRELRRGRFWLVLVSLGINFCRGGPLAFVGTSSCCMLSVMLMLCPRCCCSGCWGRRLLCTSPSPAAGGCAVRRRWQRSRVGQPIPPHCCEHAFVEAWHTGFFSAT